jgi:hypothetical protein
MHQDRACRFRLSRNPLQRLSRSNHARVEAQTFRYAVTPIFQLFQTLILFAGRPDSNRPNAFGPFRFGQLHCLLQDGMQTLAS